MARPSQRFICENCGASHRKWSGKCDACDAWNSLVEDTAGQFATPARMGQKPGQRLHLVDLNDTETVVPPRIVTGIDEFDRVLGGGLVPGAAILIGGDPGIGKSTLLLQVAARLAKDGVKAAYISGEEAIGQIQRRADRLGLAAEPVQLAAATNIRNIVATLEGKDAPRVVVIDSVQTMFVDALDSAPGTVAQVRASAQELIRLAKIKDIVIFLVGHVTKDGQIAGPRVMEHMVDTVLYFEGDRGHQFRILRTVKNRFGGTDEIGVFEMSDAGLQEVADPSQLFLSDASQGPVSGAAVFAGLEGSRPVLVEIQALVAPSPFGTPRRTVVGWDANRLAMVMAVLDARCGLGVGGHDVYLNVAGGLRISEPAADMAVAAALVSSLADAPLPARTVVFGEISLSGHLRPVSGAELRLKEAGKLGFQRVWLPKDSGPLPTGSETRKSAAPKPRREAQVPAGLGLNAFEHLRDMVFEITGEDADTRNYSS